MAARRPGTWYRVCGFNRLLAAFAASGWLLFFLSRPSGSFRPRPPDHLHFHLAAEGGEGPQARWEAAQEHALAAERQAAGRVTVNSTKPDSGSGSGSGSGSMSRTNDSSLSPRMHDMEMSEHDLVVQQPAALGMEQPADTLAAVQPAEAAQAAAHALTEEALDPVALEAVVQPAARVSSSLSMAEWRQQRENRVALAKAADMEAIRRAISASVAAAAEGRLPSASVDCEKACNFGEAPGYWRVGSHGRRQWALYDDTCALADLLSLHLQPRPVESVAYLGENATFLEATEAGVLAAFDWRRQFYNRSGAPGKLAVPHVADVVARARQQANQTGRLQQSEPSPQQVAVRRRLAVLASAAAEHVSTLHMGGPTAAAARVAQPWRRGSRKWRSLLRLQWRRRHTPSAERCLICELPTLVVANQMLWSVHPANPLKAGAGFHLGKRKSAETRLHEGWQLFLQRVGRPPDLIVVAVNFWDLAMYTKHGLGLQPHLNEPLLLTWRRDFGDLLSMVQALAGNTTRVLYHTAPVPAAGPTAREEVREYKLARAGHVAQLNAAGRAAAGAAGISYVDMALMSAAFHSPEEYLKDKLHPQPWLLLEMFNIYLNILQASAQEC